MALDSKTAALKAAEAALDKKAEDVKILDMKRLTAETDYFVICSASTSVQTQAITQEIEAAMEEAGAALARREGGSGNAWVLLDYGNIVVHVFLEAERNYYGLEKLWADAAIVDVDGEHP